MKKNSTTPKKNENTKFAFLPEMVIEHLNHSKPVAINKTNDEKSDEISNTTVSQSIVFDPMADPFDGMHIEIRPNKKKIKKTKKAKIKFIEMVTVPKSQIITTSTSKNKIIHFVKKIKLNLLNF